MEQQQQQQHRLPATKRLVISSRDPLPVQERFAALRRSGPLIYDTFINHNLYWGSLSVAWGELTGYNDEYETEQSIYFAGRSDGEFNPETNQWTGSPGEFFAAKIAISKPHTTPWQTLANLKESRNTKKINVYKRMIHPGEVNRIRSFPQAPHLIATLSDSPTRFVWNTKTQPNRDENRSDNNTATTTKKKPSSSSSSEFIEPCASSVPDFRLVGHRTSADFALDTKGSKDVISAGSDMLVLLWDITRTPNRNSNNEVSPTCTFQGHVAPVEDCSFRPGGVDAGGHQLCSVGQDRELLLWDSRQAGGLGPTNRASKIHSDDANCCAWNAYEDKILTGGSDGIVNVFDCRQLQRPMSQVKHKSSVINVRWSPHDPQVFATSDESNFVSLFRCAEDSTGAVELLLQHGTHRSTVVDFQFNPINPWVLVSVSDDSSEDTKYGGGALQTWRVNELVYKDAESDPEWAAKMQRLISQNKTTTTSASTTPTMDPTDNDQQEEE